jgi:hypothetical protein
LIHLGCLIYLVDLVCLVDLVGLVHLESAKCAKHATLWGRCWAHIMGTLLRNCISKACGKSVKRVRSEKDVNPMREAREKYDMREKNAEHRDQKSASWVLGYLFR